MEIKYEREAKCLTDEAGKFVLSLMKEHGAFIAGGAVTSVFCSSKIKDFDVFFRSPQFLTQGLSAMPRDDKTIDTDSALSSIVEGHRVQLIKVLTGSPQQIIDSFDFTVCQGAFELSDGFTFGPEFFHHLAQRQRGAQSPGAIDRK